MQLKLPVFVIVLLLLHLLKLICMLLLLLLLLPELKHFLWEIGRVTENEI